MDKKKLGTALLAALLIGLMVGGTFLYRSLSANIETQGIAAVGPNVPAGTESGVPEETRAEDNTEASEAYGTSEATENTEPSEEADMAPDFVLYDREGEQRRLSEFKGKPVILNFWASWCGPCKGEMPDFQDKFEEYGEEIHFLMVNLTDGSQETVETASSFIDSQGYTFPVYFDADLEGATYYGVNAVPVTYFLDAQGRFVAWGQGALSAEILQKGIDMLLA
jgi:thiol-disulfide isomerase/thioredoxin